jgi:photosystem II stability/assembly factor-like uncharacterized protein
MKKFILFVLFLCFVLIQTSFAQWFSQISGTTTNINSVIFIDELTGWAAGNAGVILKTTDTGNNWFPLSTGITNDLYSIHFENNNLGWAAGKGPSIIKTTNGGTNWQSQTANPSIGDIRSIYFTNPDSGWTTGYNEYSPGNFDSYISNTTDGGITWLDNYYIMDEKMFSIMFLNNIIGWDAGTAIYNTTDGGMNWSGSGAGGEFHSIIFINEGTGWIAGSDVMTNTGLVYHTTNGGINWTQQIVEPSTSFNAIFFTDNSNGWVVGSGGKIYYTNDGGNAWQFEASNVSSGLNSVFFINDLAGWAVGNNGVILKTNNAGTPVELKSFSCKIINENIELDWVTATEINNKGFEIQRNKTGERSAETEWEEIVFVNGHGTSTEENSYSFIDENIYPGIYNYRLKQIDFDGSYEYSNIVEVDIQSPDKFRLYQNYPNPFNAGTIIKYSIPQISSVTIKVYDILGNGIETLVNEEKPAGTYKLNWNANNLPSGVYFYKLKAGSFVKICKMILLK